MLKLKPLKLTQGVRIAKARRYTIDAIDYLWQQPESPFLQGWHTREICARIDQAKTDLLRGRSTHLIITVPFRHGKSDISSRYGPATLLGWNPDLEIMLGSYSADLSEDFSRDIKQVVEDPRFAELYPLFTGFDPKTNNPQKRRVLHRHGKLQALGMGGGATGKGADVLVLDDTFKNREEAESQSTRDSRWNSFQDDFFSRLAPVHICIIVQTRWHIDDTIGRIKARNTMTHPDFNPNFPQFDIMHFRARGDENIQHTGSQYLFPERFGDDWYESQFGVRSEYAASALLQGEPYIRGGNMLKSDRVNWLSPGDEFPDWAKDAHWVRHWDIAHSEKQLAKDDPDYTAGGRVAVIERKEGNLLLVDDLRAFQKEATERNRLIIEAVAIDRDYAIPQSVEACAGLKDAYTTLRDLLNGVAVVTPYYPKGDKVTRAGYVEPIFEAGNVWIRSNATVRGVINSQIANFPSSGVHDDVVDVITGGYQQALKRNRICAGKSAASNIQEAVVN